MVHKTSIISASSIEAYQYMLQSCPQLCFAGAIEVGAVKSEFAPEHVFSHQMRVMVTSTVLFHASCVLRGYRISSDLQLLCSWRGDRHLV